MHDDHLRQATQSFRTLFIFNILAAHTQASIVTLATFDESGGDSQVRYIGVSSANRVDMVVPHDITQWICVKHRIGLGTLPWVTQLWSSRQVES